MLRKKTNGVAFGPRASIANGKARGEVVDRRTFLTRSGLVAGAAAAAAAAPAGLVTRKAQAQSIAARNMTNVKSVCTHCSVGCTVIAEVDNGVWVGQEPGFDSPFNLGAHCAKGAAVREHGHGERLVDYLN